MVRIVVCGMGDNQQCGLEVAQHVHQVIKNIFAGIGGAGGEGAIVGNGINTSQRRMKWRDITPVPLPNFMRAPIRVA